MKIAINKCYGGFSLSDKAIIECIARGMTCKNMMTEEKDPDFNDCDFYYTPPKSEWPEDKQKYIFDLFGCRYNINNSSEIAFRTNPIVIAVVEEMGEDADGQCARIEIVDIPDDVDVLIEEYDGQEWVSESHRTWS